MTFDPNDNVVYETKYEPKDWTSSEFGHVQGQEELAPNRPQPRGLGVSMRAKVDSYHASDTVARRSRTGLLVWLNYYLIYWLFNKHTGVESSRFGSKFKDMKQ